MKKEIKKALQETIQETNLEKKALDKFLIQVDNHSLTSFGSKESVTELLSYIYKNEQDDLIDFITLLNINLFHNEVDNDYILKVNNVSSKLLKSTPLDTKLRNMLENDHSEDLFVSLLFIIKTNIQTCIIENSKKEQ